MSDKKTLVQSLQVLSSPITQLVGAPTVLPGESELEYQNGLVATVKELGATTPMQIYLSEKIFECLWWMRRYENQKRATLIRRMAELLDPQHFGNDVSNLEAWAMDALFANRLDDAFIKFLKKHNLTLESLNQRALESSQDVLQSLDQMIALKAKTLAGFQASYEVLVNRKVNAERMRLQNALMQRDLSAIENEAFNEQPNKSPKATSQ
jgi:hypothetical protein